jgi:hypothetical protein
MASAVASSRRIRVERPEVAVVGFVAVGTPVALHPARVGVEHGDALVLVAVGDERLVGRIANAMLATQIQHLRTGLGLFQNGK